MFDFNVTHASLIDANGLIQLNAMYLQRHQDYINGTILADDMDVINAMIMSSGYEQQKFASGHVLWVISSPPISNIQEVPTSSLTPPGKGKEKMHAANNGAIASTQQSTSSRDHVDISLMDNVNLQADHIAIKKMRDRKAEKLQPELMSLNKTSTTVDLPSTSMPKSATPVITSATVSVPSAIPSTGFSNNGPLPNFGAGNTGCNMYNNCFFQTVNNYGPAAPQQQPPQQTHQRQQPPQQTHQRQQQESVPPTQSTSYASTNYTSKQEKLTREEIAAIRANIL